MSAVPFQVVAVKSFDGAAVVDREYTVIDTCNDGQEWYHIAASENGYSWVPAHVYKKKDARCELGIESANDIVRAGEVLPC